MNYSISIRPFVSGKCGKEGRKLQKLQYLKNKKSFLDEIKNTFHSFWRAIIWWKNKNLIKNSGDKSKLLTKLWTSIYQLRTTSGKTKTPKTFCLSQSKYFHTKILKISLEIKSSASSLNFCLLNQLTQVTTMEATKMNHRSSHWRCSVKKTLLEI